MEEKKDKYIHQKKWNKANLKRVFADLPIDLVEQFDAKAKRLGISKSSIIREAIERFLNTDYD